MKLRSLHPKTFTQLFEVLKEAVTDVLIHFNTDSIKIRAADTAKTCITYVNIHGPSLDQYECTRDQPVGVNIPRLWNVLKIALADDVLLMDFGEKQADGTLSISIIDSKTNTAKLSTGYITYECDEEALSIPETPFCGTCISMSSAKFHSDLKTLETMEVEFVKLRQCKAPNGGNRLQLIGIGSQFHRSPCMNIDEAQSINPTVSSGAGASSALDEIEKTFPLKKLVHFAKAHCLDDKVAIHLNERGYLILQYKIKIYGDLRFVVMAINEAEDDDDDEDDDESPNKRQKTAAATPDEEDDE